MKAVEDTLHREVERSLLQKIMSREGLRTRSPTSLLRTIQ